LDAAPSGGFGSGVGGASNGGSGNPAGGTSNGGATSNGGTASNGGAGNPAGGMTSSGGATPNGGATSNGGTASVPDAGTSSIWHPTPGTSWQWQLSGTLDTSFDVQVYDIDLFDNSASTIDALHAAGRKVICYFDTAYEPGRPDSASLAPYEGNPVDGWPGQYWVDIRQKAVVDVMLARIDLAAQKHCDGIEADDVDSRSNNPGFPISKADQEGFIRTLADAAHAQGLAYGLKNDLDEVPDLVSVADFAINEECFQYSECDALAPFTAAGKAVFETEYTDGDLAQKGATFCSQANALNLDSIVKHLDLDAPRFSCR
jgi:hypothetical protein